MSRLKRMILFSVALGIFLAAGQQSQQPLARSTPSPSPTKEVQVGVPYPHKLFVHCGTLGTTFAGRNWDADPSISEHNPPPGWDENEEPGTMTLISQDRAEFRSSTDGKTVQFKLRPDGSPDPNENCE
jgi:hypothetical protein